MMKLLGNNFGEMLSRDRRILPRSRFLAVAFLAAAMAACDSGPSVEDHIQRATEFKAQNDTRAAIIEFKNALQKDPDAARARWMLGQIYAELGDGLNGEKEIERAKKLGFEHAELGRTLARTKLLQGKFDDVLQLAEGEPASKSEPDWAVLIGQAELGLGNLNNANAAFLTALDAQPNHPRALRGLARVAMARGQSKEAGSKVAQALAKDNDDLQTWLLKAELEMSSERFAEAQASFVRALEIDSNSVAARFGVVRALLGEQKPDQAADHLEVLASTSSGNPQVQYFQALVAEQRGEHENALALLEEVLGQSPTFGPALLLSSRHYYGRRDYERARDNLERYLKTQPESLPAIKLLGAVHLAQRRIEEALAILRRAEKSAPNDAGLMTLIGTALLSARKLDEADEYLERARELRPDAATVHTQIALQRIASGSPEQAVQALQTAMEKDPGFQRADFLLVLVHFQERHYVQALSEAEKLVEKRPDDPRAYNLLAAAYETNQDLDRARESYRIAVELNPDYVTASLNLARLDLQDKDLAQASAGYRAVLERRPDHPNALVALARIANAEGNASEALDLLEQARDRNPAALPPRLILASYYLRIARYRLALDIAREANAINARQPAVALTLARALIANNQSDDALLRLAALEERFPKSVAVQYQLAMAQALRQDATKTRHHLERALTMAPQNSRAKLALGALSIREGKHEAAHKLADEMIGIAEGKAAGQVLKGDVLTAQGDLGNAASVYRSALETQPATSTILKLYSVLQRSDPDKSEAVLDEWIAQRPSDIVVRLTRATLHHQSNRKDQAQLDYEEVLELQPENALALNNLAWLYHEREDARALALAEKAYKLFPDRAEIADTYGWLLVNDGRVQQGLNTLEKAARDAPDNGDIQYHIAAALAKTGDAAGARRQLEKLLEADASFSEKSAAQALYEELQ